MSQKELIDFCNGQKFECKNEKCECYEACKRYRRKYGTIPFYLHVKKEYYTDEVI